MVLAYRSDCVIKEAYTHGEFLCKSELLGQVLTGHLELRIRNPIAEQLIFQINFISEEYYRV
jgi:hypothetical protein